MAQANDTSVRCVRWRGLLALVVASVFVAAACARQQEGATTGNSEATTVGVKLQEWSVVPDNTSAPAGKVTFNVRNAGKSDHEFMVVRTGLALTELPAKKDGSFDEEGRDVVKIDAVNAMEHDGEEHEVVEPGKSKEFSYDLKQGKYVLVCNLVEEQKNERNVDVHFKLGMRIPFVVE